MLKQKMLYLSLLFGVCTHSIAEDGSIICPTVEQIRQGTLISWLPLYIEGEELAFDIDVDKFRKNVTHFDVARWSADYLESAHCFYKGNDSVIDRIALAQDAWRPATQGYWVWLIRSRFAECRSLNVGDCRFIR